ncbi:KR-domain-containing protein [Sporormia fimetaria CBS 119925]|uniref:KR-domain-containing protein n=1 Tax=Sporormia fimetaria CBS 119925 TaxID=1340428 RepID=A0A6A6VB44_9PLEO|nr:KR-domain-containing protein [Sporormia fimetaria CBS 119925]
MSFSVLDLEQEVESQGFAEPCFEVVVASNVLHALTDPIAALNRIRKLVRPGGYFACIELPTNGRIHTTVMLGGLPGWWMSNNNARTGSPAVSEQQWDKMLRETEFSGIDVITPAADDFEQSSRVFLTQAVDDHVMALRKPLHYAMPRNHDGVLVIGADASLLRPILAGLSSRFESIDHMASLSDITEDVSIPRKLFGEATVVLWVTHGCKAAKSSQAACLQMMIGLGRAVQAEFQDLRLRFVDLDNLDLTAARLVVRELLRWYELVLGDTAGSSQDVALWASDTELAFEHDVLFSPSVRHSESMNDRYNSQQRRITRLVEPSGSPVELCYISEGQFELRDTRMASSGLAIVYRVQVKMVYSTLQAINVRRLGFCFIGLGVDANGMHSIVVSNSLESIHQPETCAIYQSTPTSRLTFHDVWFISAEIIADRIVCSSPYPGKVLALASDRQLMDFKIRQTIPRGIAVFVNLSSSPKDAALGKRILSILEQVPTACLSMRDFVRPQPSVWEHVPSCPDAHLIPLIEQYIQEREDQKNTFEEDGGTIKVLSPDGATQSSHEDPLVLLDWTLHDHLQVKVEPAISRVQSSSSKTYIVVGSSDLAQSLCEWMINSGARYIVLASRDPSGAASWAQDMLVYGAHIELKSVDVTDAQSVRKMLTSLRTQLDTRGLKAPPIAGLVHLGMILRDTSFASMEFEDLQIVTDVKAKGSMNLHQALTEDLDFFIMTSSLAYTSGNAGQANYNAANAFMTGLARYRRNMGLPASVVQLGLVAGVGYITRTSGDNSHRPLKYYEDRGVYPISERDIQHIFAEAVLASPVESGRDPEIITGIRPFIPSANGNGKYRWDKKPMFAHLITDASSVSNPTRHREVSVQEKLTAEPTASKQESAEQSIWSGVVTGTDDGKSGSTGDSSILNCGEDQAQQAQNRRRMASEETVAALDDTGLSRGSSPSTVRGKHLD